MKFKFKQKDKVYFEEEGHKYSDGRGREYTSVTTLLKDYCPPFESDYWSDYKAIKDTLENIGYRTWKDFKDSAGGWESVVKYFKKSRKKLDQVVLDRIATRKQYYLDLWDDEREYAAELGTKHHNDLEQLLLNTPKIQLDNMELATTSPADLISIQGFDQGESIIHPELLLWNEKYRIAGQADVVERTGKKIHIKDYKTCKEIEMKAFMDKTFFSPLQELPNTNYSKFTMQLSTYGWMLEELGYEITGLTIIHIDRHTGNHVRDYPLAYRKDLVELMLDDYYENKYK
jgi:hypothetical protein